jgi:hypothetical protein
MFDLTALTPFAVAFLVFGVVAAALALATLTRLAAETRATRTRPVVLVTSDRANYRAAA